MTKWVPVFKDAELIEEGYDMITKEIVEDLIKDAGIEVFLMDKPLVMFERREFRANTTRFGTLTQIEQTLKHLKMRGVPTIGLYEVHRWPFDKLTKVRWAYSTGI